MELSSSRWKKSVTLASVATELVRGGIQKEDSGYNRQSRVPQPTAPPPPHLYSQQQQALYQSPPSQGQNASYYSGHPSSPFTSPGSSSVYLPPQQGSPPAQGYSSPPPQPHSHTHTDPRQGFSDQNQVQSSPPMGGYAYQPSGSSYGDDSGSMYADSDVAASYTSMNSPPPSHYEPVDNRHYSPGSYNSNEYVDQGPPHPHIPYALQRSATQDQTPYTNDYSYRASAEYESSPQLLDMGQRSFTVPAGYCGHQDWDPILGRCRTCKPVIPKVFP